MAGFFWLLPERVTILIKYFLSLFNRKPPQKWSRGNRGNVLLFQGVHSSWYFLKSWGDALNREGFRIFTVPGLGYNAKPLSQTVDMVKKFIIQSGLKDLIILGHSKGGRIALEMLRDAEVNPHIKKVFLVSVPVSGSLLGYLPIEGLKGLGSPFSPKHLKPDDLSRIINIYSQTDNYVIPNNNLTLKGVINIRLPVSGHTRIIDFPLTVKTILGYL